MTTGDSRPISATVPREAELVFGAALPRVTAFAARLAGPAVERGLLGPAEVPRLWERHLFNSAALLALLPVGSRLLDVGSGAGLPGLVLALARPELEVVLIEPSMRRARFLQECREEFELPGLRVVQARAEDLAGQLVGDTVTARAVAPLERLAGWALPLCREGGHLLAIKGARAGQELAAATPSLRRLGAPTWRIRQCVPAAGLRATTVVDVTAGRSPRRQARARTS